MVMSKGLLAILLSFSSACCWASLKDRFDYKITRKADGTSVFLYSIPDQYEEFREYEPDGTFRSLKSQVGNISVEMSQYGMLLTKYSNNWVQKYYFKRKQNAFVLSRVTQDKPTVYYKKGDEEVRRTSVDVTTDSTYCRSRNDPDKAFSDIFNPGNYVDKSCEDYKDKFKAVYTVLNDDAIKKCLVKEAGIFGDDFMRFFPENNFRDLSCDSKLPFSRKVEKLLKLELGSNFTNADSVKAAGVLLHENLHRTGLAYGRNLKESFCGPVSVEDVESEIYSIVEGCVFSNQNNQKFSQEIKGLRKQALEINKTMEKTIGKTFDEDDRPTRFQTIPTYGLSIREKNYLYKKIKENLNLYTKEVVKSEPECELITKKIFGNTCPFLTDTIKFLPCPFQLVKDDTDNGEAISTYDLIDEKDDDPPNPIAPDSTSGNTIPTLRNKLSEDPARLPSQVEGMLPKTEGPSSVGSAEGLMQDVTSSAKALFGFTDSPFGSAGKVFDTDKMPEKVKDRLAVLQLGTPSNSTANAKAVAGSQGTGSSAFNLVTKMVAGEPALAAQETSVENSAPIVANNSASDSAAKQKAMAKSGPAGQAGQATVGSLIGPSGDSGEHASASNNSGAINLAQHPAEFLNWVVGSRANSNQVLKAVLAQKDQLQRSGIQVVIDGKTIGALKPTRVLIWDGKKFKEK